VTKDALWFLSSDFSKCISWGHRTMYRHFPWIFRYGYAYCDKHPGCVQEGSAGWKILAAGAERLRDFLSEGKYDAVISVHVFAAIMLKSALRELTAAPLTAFVATDYTCSPGVAQCDADLYFIPHYSLKPEFLQRGVPAEKIHACGIPIRQMFCGDIEPSMAKAQRGLSSKRPHLVLMGGSMGAGPMKALAVSLCSKLKDSCEITVICGTNEKMRSSLARRFDRHGNMHILGFERGMNDIYSSADLLVTKPGGISTTEAWTKAVPMVLVDAVAGCEKSNLQFFRCLCDAASGKGVRELTDTCSEYIRFPEKRLAMQSILKETRPVCAAEKICSVVRKKGTEEVRNN